MKRNVFRWIGLILYHLVWSLLNVPFFLAACLGFLVVLVNMPGVLLIEWIMSSGPDDPKYTYKRDAKFALIIFFEFVEYIVRFGKYLFLGWHEFEDPDIDFDPLEQPKITARRIKRYVV